MADANKSGRFRDSIFDALSAVSGGNQVTLYDFRTGITRFSPGAVELFGLPDEYVSVGKSEWTDRIHPEDRKKYHACMQSVVFDGADSYNFTCRLRLKDRSYGLFRFTGSVIRDDSGEAVVIGGTVINEGLLESTDPVTGLRNQYGFFSDLNAMFETRTSGTVLLMGFRGMSDINEAHGYSYGNRVLQQMGWLLEEALGAEGTVYRMDGVRFAYISTQLTAKEVAPRYEAVRQTLLGGIQVGKIRQSLILSGGMVTAGKNVINERTLHSCLNFAYAESRDRQNGLLVDFDGTTKRDTGIFLDMLDVIRNSVLLDYRGFSLHYQPVVEAGTEKLLGAEALLRWHESGYGEVTPLEYVPVLERDFVFEELGYWILRQAMTDGRKILEQDPSFTVGVNLARVQLEDSFFLEELRAISKETSFPLSNLCLELTRGCRLLRENTLKETVTKLQEAGVRIIIDDFGSGVSSIDHLRDLSADCIKFDRKYIHEIDSSEEDRQIVLNLSALAKACGTKVIVKGVDRREILDTIRQDPVNALQGDYFSAPLPYEKFMQKYYPEAVRRNTEPESGWGTGHPVL